MSRRIVESAIAAGDLDTGLEAHRRIVEDYNREDCESALRLRDWLERLRAEARADGHELPRPAVESGEASEEISDLDRELQRLRDGLLEGVPVEPAERSPEQQARFALAHMMEFHRREDKAGWWEYFRLLGLEERELAEERRALTGLAFQAVLEAKRAPLQRYSFPAQEVDARKGDEVYDALGAKIGTVAASTSPRARSTSRRRQKTADEHPTAVFFHNQVSSAALRKSLMRLGEAVLANGFSVGDPWRAAIDLLLRRAPAPRRCERPPAAARRDDRAGRLPHRARTRRQRARDPGSARHGQDLHRRAHHLRARARGAQGGRHGGQPQGDRQPARGRGEAGARGGAFDLDRPPRRGCVSRSTWDRATARLRRHPCGARRRHDPGARRHRVVLGTPGFRAKRRRADRRRGRPDVARQRAGHGARRAQPRPARRPAAARAAAAEQPPRGQRGVGALSRAGRRGHDARGQGTVPGRDVSAPSGHREVHVRGLLRGQGRSAPGTRATGDRFARRIRRRRSRVPG